MRACERSFVGVSAGRCLGQVGALAVVFCTLGGPGGRALAAEKIADKPTTVAAAFGAGCEKLLLDALGTATNEIQVAVFSFTRRNVSQALVRAASRKVKVTVKYDVRSLEESEGMAQTIGYLRNRGVNCLGIAMSGEHAKMHHKFAVVDGRVVVTGSWNYTSTGVDQNYENVVRIESEEVARAFLNEFEGIRDR